jgi:hypothetical protein
MEQLFSQYSLQGSTDNQPKAMREKVESFGEDYILTTPEEDLVEALAGEAEWNPPAIGEPFIAADREINVRRSHTDYGRSRTHITKATQIEVHIPFSGDATFFRMQPPHSQWTPLFASIDSDHLEIILEGSNLSSEALRREIEKFVTDLKFHLDQIVEAAKSHNAAIADKIRPLIQQRKKRILERREMVSSIGLPIKQREDAPKTYAVPNVRRKAKLLALSPTQTSFVPEPALDEKEYQNILSIMRSMVQVMERSPNAFQHLKEEDLRWQFLVQLNGQYEGRATGETFNYKGDTDILIREKDRNVFIGECKVWKGPGSLTGAIDQMLDRYLHWRDTKTAILIFNRNKNFSDVLAQIQPTVASHPCFKRTVRQTSEAEWRFGFCNRDDANREVHLSVLAFDIPGGL